MNNLPLGTFRRGERTRKNGKVKVRVDHDQTKVDYILPESAKHQKKFYIDTVNFIKRFITEDNTKLVPNKKEKQVYSR